MFQNTEKAPLFNGKVSVPLIACRFADTSVAKRSADKCDPLDEVLFTFQLQLQMLQIKVVPAKLNPPYKPFIRLGFPVRSSKSVVPYTYYEG